MRRYCKGLPSYQLRPRNLVGSPAYYAEKYKLIKMSDSYTEVERQAAVSYERVLRYPRWSSAEIAYFDDVDLDVPVGCCEHDLTLQDLFE